MPDQFIAIPETTNQQLANQVDALCKIIKKHDVVVNHLIDIVNVLCMQVDALEKKSTSRSCKMDPQSVDV